MVRKDKLEEPDLDAPSSEDRFGVSRKEKSQSHVVMHGNVTEDH